MITANFVTAGKAEFTIDNGKGTHYTFRVRKGKKVAGLFVSHVSGGAHYMGVLTSNLTLKTTPKATVSLDSTEAKVFAFAMCIINGTRALPDGYSIRHTGKCGRCARKLTDPVSIASGIGPDCAEIVNAERAKSIADESASLKATVDAVRESVAQTPTSHTCHNCGGSGIYRWGGSVNGMARFSGKCYRCGGKGKQDRADERRNYGYDNFYRSMSL